LEAERRPFGFLQWLASPEQVQTPVGGIAKQSDNGLVGPVSMRENDIWMANISKINLKLFQMRMSGVDMALLKVTPTRTSSTERTTP
jgi:hypothetical protein